MEAKKMIIISYILGFITCAGLFAILNYADKQTAYTKE
jgi:hypothetical protein